MLAVSRRELPRSRDSDCRFYQLTCRRADKLSPKSRWAAIESVELLKALLDLQIVLFLPPKSDEDRTQGN